MAAFGASWIGPAARQTTACNAARAKDRNASALVSADAPLATRGRRAAQVWGWVLGWTAGGCAWPCQLRLLSRPRAGRLPSGYWGGLVPLVELLLLCKRRVVPPQTGQQKERAAKNATKLVCRRVLDPTLARRCLRCPPRSSACPVWARGPELTFLIAKAKRRTAHPSPSLDDRLPSPPSPSSPPSSSASPPPAAAASSSSAEAASSSAARGAAPLSSSSPPSLIAPCRPSTRDPRPSMSSPPPNLTLMPVACTRSRARGL